MAWNLSTGAVKALLGKVPSVKASVNGVDISFGDGDGVVISGADTINQVAAGLTAFDKHAFILVVASGHANHNILVQALDVAAGKIEVVAGSFSAVAAGANISLVQLETGSVQELFKNGNMEGYSGVRPTSADNAESGVKLIEITRDGSSFVTGEDTNGLNLGQFSDTVLKRAIDPTTGVTEVWKGIGLVQGTAGYIRWYANNKITGASTDAIRMDGVVAQSGADANMVNGTGIEVGIYSEVTDVSFTMSTS